MPPKRTTGCQIAEDTAYCILSAPDHVFGSNPIGAGGNLRALIPALPAPPFRRGLLHMVVLLRSLADALEKAK